MTLLFPLGLALALVGVVPLAAAAAARRRAERVRRELALPPPESRRTYVHAAALAAVAALLALATAQPALTSTQTRRVRADAETFLVLDVSRSMLAARPGSPTRLARAKSLATEVAHGLGDVPVGVATLTDRLLPNLFPTAGEAVVAETIRRSVVAERPPPRETNVVATTFGALGDAAGANLFATSSRRRLLVVFTDGESRSFGEAGVARRLRAADVELVLVHVWRLGERLEDVYRPDAASAETLRSLAAAVGGRALEEGDGAAGIVSAARAALGSGRTEARGTVERLTPLGGWIALVALAPLALVLRARNFS